MARFRDKLQFSRQKLEFVYSIAILLLVPLCIIANTLWVSVTFRSNIDSELRRKADLANVLIASIVKDKLSDQPALEQAISEVKDANEELARVAVAVPGSDGRGFTEIVDTIQDQDTTDIKYVAAALQGQAVAQLETRENKRYWSVVSPLTGDEGQIQAMILSEVSLERSDNLAGRTLVYSMLLVFFTVIVISLLLVNHFRFVEYAMLFRKLKEVDQLKSDFLSVATHELRAPMTVIKGSVENLTDGVTGSIDAKAKESLQAMSGEIDRLNNLINDLLNVTRIEQGRISYAMQVFDARDVVEHIVEQYQGRAKEKGLTLVYNRPEVIENIEADKGRFTEIMTNLVDNAIKYSLKGEVTVSHKSGKNNVEVSVRDTGIGMSAAERDRLFSRFYRIQNDKTKSIPGTGLGLWIIKQYVEGMHGTISVDSMENVGTEFTVMFPRTSKQI